MNFPGKYNIHTALTSELNDEVVNLNKLLVTKYHSRINFSYPTCLIPHITLIMGTIETFENYLEIIRILSEFEIIPFEFSLETSTFSSNKRDYLFMYPNKIEEFMLLKMKVYKDIKNLILCSKYGGVENKPHLTLGYFSLLNHQIVLDLRTNSKGIFNNLSIGQTGNFGSCINSILIKKGT